MCGILGLVVQDKKSFNPGQFKHSLESLFKLSQSRGAEAAGIAAIVDDEIQVIKAPTKATQFLRTDVVCNLQDRMLRSNSSRLAFIGHSRMVTNGSEEDHCNNQPVIADQIVGVHNGILVNIDPLWDKFCFLNREALVDSELLLKLIPYFAEQTGRIDDALRMTYQEIEGVACIAALFTERDVLALATNNGSLYFTHSAAGNAFMFASERLILEGALKQSSWFTAGAAPRVTQLKAGTGLVVDLVTLTAKTVDLRSSVQTSNDENFGNTRRRTVDMSPNSMRDRPRQAIAKKSFSVAQAERMYPYNTDYADSLIRCSRCVLPDTMPFIAFDEAGVCNFCKGYQPIELYGEAELRKRLEPVRSSGGVADCLVGLSGGRDSCYGLHYVKNVLGLNPIAYTYDWGMVTDLARRNISRMCSKLGVEHILVSADIPAKRRFIRSNVTAWLKRPELGLIPLFMAGDKAYFYHAFRLKKQLQLGSILLGENMLERTDFKMGFAGLRPEYLDPDRVYTLSLGNKTRLVSYFAREYLKNLGYINRSLLDSLFAFACYYVFPRDYLNLYKFIPWKEEEIVSTLRGEYDWEVASDSNITWRIGDGTAAFYNFIYYSACGFTENDTFRSNQIREGLLDREKALEHIRVENQPRFPTIQWYCETNGIDFSQALRVIANLPKVPRLGTGASASGAWAGESLIRKAGDSAAS